MRKISKAVIFVSWNSLFSFPRYLKKIITACLYKDLRGFFISVASSMRPTWEGHAFFIMIDKEGLAMGRSSTLAEQFFLFISTPFYRLFWWGMIDPVPPYHSVSSLCLPLIVVVPTENRDPFVVILTAYIIV